MARVSAAKTKILLLRKSRSLAHGIGQASGVMAKQPEKPPGSVHSSGRARSDEEPAKEGLWVPHPRTGIYCPRGQERVMEDVPEGAACLKQTYWLRGVEGVDEKWDTPH